MTSLLNYCNAEIFEVCRCTLLWCVHCFWSRIENLCVPFPRLKPEKPRQSRPETFSLGIAARCHGIDGKGETDLGRKYDVPDLVSDAPGMSSSKIKRAIANGKHDMPAFGEKLTRKQIAALTAYIKKL